MAETVQTLPAERRTEVLRQSWSVGIATGLYGISFGALSVAAGLDLWQTQALSLLMFTGGSQFAFVGIIGTGGLAAAPAAIATATMLSIRNGLYALQTRKFLDARGAKRLAAAQLTIDESTAVGLAQPEQPAQKLGFWHTGIAVFLFWNLMTFIGALAGNAMGDPKVYGLDGAAVAAFTALVWPRLASTTARLTAALAVALALVSSPLVPAGIPVLIAALAAVALGLRSAAHHEPPLEGEDGELPGSDPVP
ncbi:MAG: AzlC family ABC transporter permease [Intrasporangiaceae bacterium]|nr:AzlC family ABC transporter permease [Intrasporangiaceae bacterium]